MYGVLPVQGSGHHVHDGQPHQPDHNHPGIRHGTEPFRKRRVANINIALDCQGKSQPVRGCVEDLRSCLHGKLKQEAGIRRPGVSGVALHGVVEHIPETGHILTDHIVHGVFLPGGREEDC